MTNFSLQQADLLHQAISAASIPAGLSVQYQGALARQARRGLEPLYQTGAWHVYLPVPKSSDETGELRETGYPLFTLKVMDAARKRGSIELPGSKGSFFLYAEGPSADKSAKKSMTDAGLDFNSFIDLLLQNLKRLQKKS